MYTLFDTIGNYISLLFLYFFIKKNYRKDAKREATETFRLNPIHRNS